MNDVGSAGGAISTQTTYNGSYDIGKIKGDFIGNSVQNWDYKRNEYPGAQGGAIYVQLNTKIDEISKSNFISNYAGMGYGGAIYNEGKIGKIENTNFYDNHAGIQGGAIYTSTDLNIVASDGFISVFDGNYIESADGTKDYQAIYAGGLRRSYTVDSIPVELTLSAKNIGKIVMNDKISGDVNIRTYTKEYKVDPTLNNKNITLYKDKNGNILFKTYYDYNSSNKYVEFYVDENNNEIGQNLSLEQVIIEKAPLGSYTLHIDGDSSGVVYLNNKVEGVSGDEQLPSSAEISLSNTQLHLGLRDNVLDGNNLPLNSGTFNMINGTAGISALNTLTINGETNFIADVDLANKEMDRFTATTYGNHSGNLNVIGMNLLSNATDGSDVTAI